MDRLEQRLVRQIHAEPGAKDQEVIVARRAAFDLDPQWGALYASRNVIDRNAAEESIQPKDTWENSVRKMLGLPLDGGTLDLDTDIWLHRLPLEDAARGYKNFKEEQDSWTKVILKPGMEKAA